MYILSNLNSWQNNLSPRSIKYLFWSFHSYHMMSTLKTNLYIYNTTEQPSSAKKDHMIWLKASQQLLMRLFWLLFQRSRKTFSLNIQLNITNRMPDSSDRINRLISKVIKNLFLPLFSFLRILIIIFLGRTILE